MLGFELINDDFFIEVGNVFKREIVSGWDRIVPIKVKLLGYFFC